MTRTAGFALLLAASCLVSLELMRNHRRRVAHTEALLRLVRYIKGNIDFFLTPVEGILSSYSDIVLEKCGFAPIMRDSGLSTAADGGQLTLPYDAERAFSDFAHSLGTSLREEEVKRCTYLEEVLSGIIETERETLEKNISLYRFVPPLCALSVILTVL